MTARPHAIVTASDASYGQFLLEHWLPSLRAHVNLTNIEIHVLDYGLNASQRSRLEAEGIHAHSCRKDGHVVNLRYRDAARVLRLGDYDQVLMLDSGDVIIQADIHHLFNEHKDRFRAVCEEIPTSSRELFDFFNPQSEEVRARSSEVLSHLEGKPIINGGFVLGPSARVIALWDDGREFWGDSQVFARDQFVINFILYREGFVALESRYNFVVSAMKKRFIIRDGVFLDARAEPIPIVHNTGRWAISRCVRNFGYGKDRNRLKVFTLAALRVVSALFGVGKRVSFAAPLFSGLLLGLSFWPGTSGWWAWLALAPLFICIHRKAPGAAFWRGWIFGTAAWGLGMHGFAAGIAKALQSPAAVGWAAQAALCLYSGLMYAMLAWCVAWLSPRLSGRIACPLEASEAVVVVPAFVCIEMFFPMVFPNQLANTQFFHLPAVQSADIFGTAGLCWLIAAFNSGLALYFLSRRRHRWVPLTVVAVLALFNEAYGRRRIRQIDREISARLQEKASLRVGLLQSGAEGNALRSPEDLRIYNALTRQALAQGPLDLLIWPENSYSKTLTFSRNDAALDHPDIEGENLERALRRDITPSGTDVLLNAMAQTRPRSRRFYTSFLIDASDRVHGLIAKRDRTPLFESLPFDDFLRYPQRLIPPQLWLLHRGVHRILTTTRGVKLGVYLCYESLLEASAREYVRDGAELLVNPANSDELQPPRLLEQNIWLGAMRAVENRRYVLRPSTRSVVIDPVGRIVQRLPLGRTSFLIVEPALMQDRPLHVRFGNAFYLLGALMLSFLAAIALWPSKRRIH